MRATSGGKVAMATAAFWVLLTGTTFAATDTLIPTQTTARYCNEGLADANVCQTDNETLSYYMDSGGTYELESNDRIEVVETVTEDYAPTDLVISYDSSPSFSGDAETDHIWQEGSTGLEYGIVGIAWCDDAVGNGYRCDQQYIRIRGNGNINPATTCHEMGHGVGLLHGNGSYPKRDLEDAAAMGCMVAGGYETTLGTNNINNINATY